MAKNNHKVMPECCLEIVVPAPLFKNIERLAKEQNITVEKWMQMCLLDELKNIQKNEAQP